MLLFSANTENSLKQYMSSIQSYISSNSTDSNNRKKTLLRDMAYTLARHREVLPHWAYMVVNPDGTIVESSTLAHVRRSSPPVSSTTTINNNDNNNSPPIVLVFRGQSAQWPQMGKGLFETSEGFRKDIRQMDLVLKGLMYPPEWSLECEFSLSFPLLFSFFFFPFFFSSPVHHPEPLSLSLSHVSWH